MWRSSFLILQRIFIQETCVDSSISCACAHIWLFVAAEAGGWKQSVFFFYFLTVSFVDSFVQFCVDLESTMTEQSALLLRKQLAGEKEYNIMFGS